jgi:tetratricopeptide (TPR) repeat protein
MVMESGNNTVLGAVHGRVVQAGAVHGGITLSTPPRPPPLPRQLPAAPASFTGRDAELSRLSDVLDSTSETVVVAAITGSGGIGKTSLALHWAYQHLDRFPDGQLFVDLRGVAPAGEPLPPSVVVRGFLSALGVDPDPVDPQTQAASYRSAVADKRILIVLDNAHDTAQIVPLLPGSPTCTVLITSRDRLHGATVTHGARPFALDVLSDAEARALLVRRVGAERVDAEPDAVAELVLCCAGLPLALSIVAARAAARPGFPLRVWSDELRDVTTRLTAFDDSEAAASLPATLSWSCAALDADRAGVFELVGSAPGPDIGVLAAASLTGLPVDRVASALRDLERASLVQQHVPGRYRMHDLIRLYADEQAHRNLNRTERRAALKRLVAHYTRTADRLLRSEASYAAACEWLEAEHACLSAAQRTSAALGWHRAVWKLAWVLDTFFYRRGHVDDQLATCLAGLTAAEHLGNPDSRAKAHRLLGGAYLRANRHQEALDHLDRALSLAERSGNRPGQAKIHQALARAREQDGDHQRALEHADRALRLHDELGNVVGRARALDQVGCLLALLGRHESARTSCRAALSLFRELGDRHGEANTMDSLGTLAHLVGDHDQAVSHYEQALVLFRDLDQAFHEANTLTRLGEAAAERHDHEHARSAWQEALRLHRAQHRADDAALVERRLDECGPTDR